MPRQVRIEYGGAIYHVMVRGDHREMIVRDNEDRKRFEKSLEKVVRKMGNDKKLRKQWGGVDRNAPYLFLEPRFLLLKHHKMLPGQKTLSPQVA